MTKYIAKNLIKHNGCWYNIGDPIDLTDYEAAKIADSVEVVKDKNYSDMTAKEQIAFINEHPALTADALAKLLETSKAETKRVVNKLLKKEGQ